MKTTKVDKPRKVKLTNEEKESLLSYVMKYPNVYNENNRVISKSCKLVLGQLLKWETKSDDGIVIAGHRELAESTKLDKNTVKRAIDKLMDLKFITRISKGCHRKVKNEYGEVVSKGENSKYKSNHEIIGRYEMVIGINPKKLNTNFDESILKSNTLILKNKDGINTNIKKWDSLVKNDINTNFELLSKLSDIERLMNNQYQNINDKINGINSKINGINSKISTSILIFEDFGKFIHNNIINILYNIITKDINISSIHMSSYSNLFFNILKEKINKKKNYDMLNELSIIENLCLSFLEKLKEKNIISDDEYVKPSIQDTMDYLSMSETKTESLSGMNTSSESEKTTVFEDEKEDNKKINNSSAGRLRQTVHDSMVDMSSSSKIEKNKFIPLTTSTSLPVHEISDDLSSGGNENDNPNVREVTSSMDNTTGLDMQEDEKQNKIVHLHEEPHPHTDNGEAHNPQRHLKKYLRGGGGAAATEKHNVQFAASTTPKLSQENPQTSSYSTDDENVQNNGMYEWEDSSDDSIHNNGISQADIDDAMNTKGRWRTVPVKYYGKWTCFNQLLDSFMAEDKKGADTYYRYKDFMFSTAQKLMDAGEISPAAYSDFFHTFKKCSKKYLNYWAKKYETYRPNPSNPSEQRMFEELGFPPLKNNKTEESSENRSGAQENSQTCNYTIQGENVQNRGTIRSERGMIDNIHATDIHQKNEKLEKSSNGEEIKRSEIELLTYNRLSAEHGGNKHAMRIRAKDWAKRNGAYLSDEKKKYWFETVGKRIEMTEDPFSVS